MWLCWVYIYISLLPRKSVWPWRRVWWARQITVLSAMVGEDSYDHQLNQGHHLGAQLCQKEHLPSFFPGAFTPLITRARGIVVTPIAPPLLCNYSWRTGRRRGWRRKVELIYITRCLFLLHHWPHQRPVSVSHATCTTLSTGRISCCTGEEAFTVVTSLYREQLSRTTDLPK